MKKIKYFVVAFFLIVVLFIFNSADINSWGFYVHRKVNRMAVFTLPPQMIGFYKNHIEYITEHSGDPDRRKFADEKEGVRHYIDIEHYGNDPFNTIPKIWKDAVAKYTEDTLQLYGINPWWIEVMQTRLTNAFKELDVDKILFVSANIGHYIGDANVPLHTSEFYDGKTPDQKGIHGLWESRIPELLAEDYDFFVGRAEYIEKPNELIWKTIKKSHEDVDTIFAVEEKLRDEYPSDKKYSFENKGQTLTKVYSKEYSLEFNRLLNGMIEERMKSAIKMVGSMWYTAWVNAGQPDLSSIENKEISDAHKKEIEEQEKMWKTGKVKDDKNIIKQ
ncbi:MAG: S1/P1 Nuclease [Bacteroidetes bacterium]|nr:S1/P1 Nuclease [Bacteroidota bacterium]